MRWHHEPVLLKEVLAYLLTPKTAYIFDGTLGLGGHAAAILEAYPNLKAYYACDLDAQHLRIAQERLKPWKEKCHFYTGNFSEVLEKIPHPPGAMSFLLDLGLCSAHVDNPERGFSFQQDGPLSLSFEGKALAASELLNNASEEELRDIFSRYGEEPLASKIARNIVAIREKRAFTHTQQLRAAVEAVSHPKERKKTLTRVFQALRIAVNDELTHLEKALAYITSFMQPGDRLGVISYHSLEDRLVKRHFRALAPKAEKRNKYAKDTEKTRDTSFKLLFQKPIKPSLEEVSKNPRARSARLRIIEKL